MLGLAERPDGSIVLLLFHSRIVYCGQCGQRGGYLVRRN